MRFVYFGTAPFAVPALRAIADSVVLVVSQPDRPSGRKMEVHPSPVKLVAQELGIPVETPEKCRDAGFVEMIQGLEADALIVAAYGQIMSVKLLESAKFGGFNLHGSILPKYRGAAPIQRALMDGESETGVTLMQMAKGMDTGDMIDIVRTPIGPDETYGELAGRLADLAAAQLLDWAERLASGDYPRVAQVEAEATYAAKIERSDARLSFERTAGEEYNRFRAVTPSPGAFISTKFGELKILGARLSGESGLRVGEILASENLVVGFESGAQEWTTVQLSGKKPVSALDFARGMRLQSCDSIKI